MKKSIFIFLVLTTINAGMNLLLAQTSTLSSSAVEFRYCFATTGEETVTEICGQPYLWNGTYYNASGDYEYNNGGQLKNARGCDSTAILHFTFQNNKLTNSVNVGLCEGKTYKWRDAATSFDSTINTVGTYVHTFSSAQGCDSTVTLTVSSSSDCPPAGVPSKKSVFSVSATQQVYFSQGNLQFHPSIGTHMRADNTEKEGTWRFALHQYDIVGDAGGNLSRDTWMDIFCYGASGARQGGGPISPTTKTFCAEQNIAGTNFDWGVYNAISNGGNTPGQWRTLTTSEWTYLYSTRTNADQKKAYGKIDGTYGIILLPDSFLNPLSRSLYNSWPYACQTYTVQEWEALEEAGAIFLPNLVDYHGGTNEYITIDQARVRYWTTSTKIVSSGMNPHRVYSSIEFYWSQSSVNLSSPSEEWRSATLLPVRLVQNK